MLNVTPMFQLSASEVVEARIPSMMIIVEEVVAVSHGFKIKRLPQTKPLRASLEQRECVEHPVERAQFYSMDRPIFRPLEAFVGGLNLAEQGVVLSLQQPERQE